jgi:hypothetical protein
MLTLTRRAASQMQHKEKAVGVGEGASAGSRHHPEATLLDVKIVVVGKDVNEEGGTSLLRTRVMSQIHTKSAGVDNLGVVGTCNHPEAPLLDAQVEW